MGSNRMKLYSVARQAPMVMVTKRQIHQLPFMMGIGEWWSYVGKVKTSSQVVPFAEVSGAKSQAVVDASNKGEMGVTGCTASQARFVANADQEPGWYKGFNIWKMRQDLGGHNTKYGLLIDDTKNILLNDYADMRDRMYDDARQDYHYRIIVGDIYATNKNIMEYENWSPISADHHYLNPVGRQYEAEQDEKEVVNHATKQAGLFDMPPFSFRTWARNFMTYKSSKSAIDESVLRSQF